MTFQYKAFRWELKFNRVEHLNVIPNIKQEIKKKTIWFVLSFWEKNKEKRELMRDLLHFLFWVKSRIMITIPRNPNWKYTRIFGSIISTRRVHKISCQWWLCVNNNINYYFILYNNDDNNNNIHLLFLTII